MDRVGMPLESTIATQAVATSTTPSASGTSTIPAPSESVAPGKSISTSYQFIITDSDGDSNGIPQLLSEDETTPPEPSSQPPVPKLVLKRKLKRTAAKAKVEDQATVKTPKKKKKRAAATKSSAKAEKLIVKLPHGQQQLPLVSSCKLWLLNKPSSPAPVRLLTELMIAAATPRVMVTPLIHPPLETRQPRLHFHSKSSFEIFIHTAFLV